MILTRQLSYKIPCFHFQIRPYTRDSVGSNLISSRRHGNFIGANNYGTISGEYSMNANRSLVIQPPTNPPSGEYQQIFLGFILKERTDRFQ